MLTMSVDEMENELGREGNLPSCSSFQHVDRFHPNTGHMHVMACSCQHSNTDVLSRGTYTQNGSPTFSYNTAQYGRHELLMETVAVNVPRRSLRPAFAC